MKKILLNLMKLRTAMMLAAVVVTFLGLPTKAWADDVASVTIDGYGTWNFASLDQAINVVNEPTDHDATRKLTLLGNVTNLSSSLSFYRSSTFILDLNGHTLSGSASTLISISSGSTLTITDSGTGGTISATGNDEKGVVFNSGTLTISGGTITATGSHGKGICIDSNGTLTINGGTISTAGESGIAISNEFGNVIINGGNIVATGDYGESIHSRYIAGSTVTINGGTISSKYYGINSNESTTVNISGGTFKGCNTAIYIEGGTFNLNDLPSFGSGDDANTKDIYISNLITFGAAITDKPAQPIKMELNFSSLPYTFTSGYGTYCKYTSGTHSGEVIAPDDFFNVVNAGSASLGLTEGNEVKLYQKDPGGNCGEDVYWSYNSSTKTLTISGTGAMADYTKLEKVPWHSEIYNTVTIGDNITHIGDYAFIGSSISTITIPANVTSIGKYAFNLCLSLTSVVIADGSQLETIEEGAFSSCIKLPSITIPATVKTIGIDAFASCSKLQTVTFAAGSSLETIGVGAFSYCSILGSITIPSTVTSIGNKAFFSSGLTSVTIPASVTSLGNAVFESCTSLTAITVDDANEYYKNVDGVLMNNAGTTLIAYPAGKTGATYTIPSTVTSIADGAFAGDTNLQTLFVMQDTPPTLGGTGVFRDGLTIRVPGSNLATYQSSWSTYSEQIKGLYTITTANGANISGIPDISEGSTDYYHSGSEIQVWLDEKATAPEGYGGFIGFKVTNAAGEDITSTEGLLTKNDGEVGYTLVTPESDITITALWKTIPVATVTGATGLVYDGNEKALIDAENTSTTGGTLKYSLDKTTWDTEIPTKTAANTYDVYYMVEGNDTYEGIAASETNKVQVTIAPLGVTLTANSRDTDVFDGTEKTVTGFTCSVAGLTFDGVSASGSGTNAGDYDVTFTGVTLNDTKDTSGNYVVTETINGKLTINPVAGLIVSNKVVSAAAEDASRTFEFTVTLSNTTINGSYGEMTFENGVATFSLQDGEQKTAEGLPSGTTFTVTQTSVEGFDTTKEGDTGTISTTASTAAFTNTRETGNLTVSNELVSTVTADADMEFTFTVTLSNTTINGDFGGMTFENGVATITLKGGEQKTAAGIPTDISYTVTQTAAEGFVTTKEGDTGTISTTTSTAAFTNTRIMTYTLDGVEFAGGMHYATYCNTTGKNLTIPEGLKAYAVSGVNGEVVMLAEVEFLPTSSGTTYFPLLLYRAETSTSVGTAYEYTGTATAPTYTHLRYALENVTTTGKEYVLYNDEFVKATGTILAGARYLDLGGTFARRLSIGSEATGIKAIDNGKWTMDNWYDLQGRRIEKPTKPGLYIKNGQKQIVKQNHELH